MRGYPRVLSRGYASSSFGAVAQLGERRFCKAKAVGSTPTGSIMQGQIDIAKCPNCTRLTNNWRPIFIEGAWKTFCVLCAPDETGKNDTTATVMISKPAPRKRESVADKQSYESEPGEVRDCARIA